MLILKRIAPAVCHTIPPTMWGATPQVASGGYPYARRLWNMDQLSRIITCLDDNGAFPNTPDRLPQVAREQIGLPLGGFPTGIPCHLPVCDKSKRRHHRMSPSYWPSKCDVPTPTWHHTPYRPHL